MQNRTLFFKKAIQFLCFYLTAGISFLPLHAQNYKTKYEVKGSCIAGTNLDRYNNRPLYINNTDAFILTGDKPIARLVRKEYVYGTFMLAIERNGKGKWLQNCGKTTSFYDAGKMSWEISDEAFPGLKILLDILPMASKTGMAIRLKGEGILPGDKLIWAFGGAQWRKDQNLSWKLDVMGQPELLTWGFVPEECKNNSVEIKDKSYFVRLPDAKSTANTHFNVAGSCSSPTQVNMGEASGWNNAASFAKSKSLGLPL
ncbi:DUF4450 domain-containing protein, partial [bacterium]|nr:DUF4450 domain-containing protein [bacterium]